MANVQYIGARYVPKFFENPDDQSNDWKAGVLYEALMIVTYNNDSYTSKKTVPPSVGNPADNPVYWACTTKYTAALMALQTTVQNLEDYVDLIPLDTEAQTVSGAINELVKAEAYVTPEMFGAVGDGVANDTMALLEMLSDGRPCVLNGTYKTIGMLAIPANRTIIVNGTIHYTGAECALRFNDPYVYIGGTGQIISDGEYCLDIKTHDITVEKVIISCRTTNCIAAVNMTSISTANGVYGNKISDVAIQGRSVNDPYGVGLYLHSQNDGWVNENFFEKINFIGFTLAIRMHNETSAVTMNRNRFEFIDTENSTKALMATATTTYIRDNTFNFRTEEFTDGTLQIDERFINNFFKVRGLKPSFFSVLNPSAKALFTGTIAFFNYVEGIIWSNTYTPLGYNGAFHVNGDVVVFDVNSKRLASSFIAGSTMTLDYSGNWATTYPLGYIQIDDTVSDMTIDLNYLSDWCSSPLEHIYIGNSGGTHLKIVNDSTTLADKTLAQGLYRCVYMRTKAGIYFVKEDVM